MSQRAKMTRWYDPPRLLFIGIRAAVSMVFGEFADRREMMVGAREIDPIALDPIHDYRAAGEDREFWFDFIADNGDGWNPTYAIARLLAEPKLRVSGLPDALPMGRFVVMGGDQVYPTASRADYQEKLVAPFDQAQRTATWPAGTCPDLYAIPGNHDWYDGLQSFLGLFCRRRRAGIWPVARAGRVIGGRQTQQIRSYFALKLPHNWWLWGADIQLRGYIDQPQIDFFRHVAEKWMDPEGSRLILCTGQPSWAYVAPQDPEPAFKNYSYLESLAGLANPKHRLCLVLTGDSHHYSRYSKQKNPDRRDSQYITAGGGGAFLHPTHHLDNKEFWWDYPEPGVAGQREPEGYRRTFAITVDRNTGRESLYPDRGTSKRLSLGNLGFACLNWQFWLSLAVIAGIFTWLLHANAQITGSSLAPTLAPVPGLNWIAFRAGLCAYLTLVFVSPWPLILGAAAFGGYYYFAEFPSWQRWLAGALHQLAQSVVLIVVTVLLALWFTAADYRLAFVICIGTMTAVFVFGRYLIAEIGILAAFAQAAVTIGAVVLLAFYCGWLSPTWALIMCVAIIGGFLAATIMGIYLLVCLTWFQRHWNHAFSSLRIENYKNFIRIRIDAGGRLTVYPIGLARVPRDDTCVSPRNPPLHPHLIETQIEVE